MTADTPLVDLDDDGLLEEFEAAPDRRLAISRETSLRYLYGGVDSIAVRVVDGTPYVVPRRPGEALVQGDDSPVTPERIEAARNRYREFMARRESPPGECPTCEDFGKPAGCPQCGMPV